MFKKLSIALASLLAFTGQAMAEPTDYTSLSNAFAPGTSQIVTIAGVVMGVIAVIFTIRKTLGVAKKSA